MNSEHKPNDNGIPTPCTPLTVRSLARRLGVDRRTIARWIAGGILLPEQRHPVTMFLWGKVVDALQRAFGAYGVYLLTFGAAAGPGRPACGDCPYRQPARRPAKRRRRK